MFLGQIKFFLGNRVFIGRSSTYLFGKSVCIVRSRKDFKGKTFSIDNQIYIYWVKLLSLLDQVNIYYVNCFGFVWGKLFIGSSCKDLFEYNCFQQILFFQDFYKIYDSVQYR